MPTGAAGARLGDRKRLAGSAYVWARATCGEHVFAPTPPELRNDAARQEIWKTDLTTVCSLLKRAQRFPRYLMLKERLDALRRPTRQLPRWRDKERGGQAGSWSVCG